jgi:hypothetical protein
VVLENAYERIYVNDNFGDVKIDGWFIARAENIVLVGELDGQEADVANLTRVEEKEIRELQKVQRLKDEEKRKALADVIDEMIVDEF